MISPDLPITRSSDDKLNRQSFAESLARVLLRSTFPTSFTVGLYGEWGSGKTSLLNMVIEQVEAKNKDVIVLILGFVLIPNSLSPSFSSRWQAQSK